MQNVVICHAAFSDWLVFGRDFTVRAITMETVLFGFFFFALPLPQNSNSENARRLKKGKVWSWYKTGMNEVNTGEGKRRNEFVAWHVA